MYYVRSLWDVSFIRYGLVLLLIAIALVVWSSWAFVQAANVASREWEAVAECKRYAKRLETIRSGQRMVSDTAPSQQESLSTVRDALQFARISEDSLADLRYGQPAAIINSSSLLREDLVIGVRAVTIRQILDLATHLEQSESAGICVAIQLNASDASLADAAEAWDAQLTLTRLIRSAKSPSVRK